MKDETTKNLVQKEFSPKVLELREKILDDNYVNNAIQRIAFVLSRKIVEKPKGRNMNKHPKFPLMLVRVIHLQ